MKARLLAAFALGTLAAGGILTVAGREAEADLVWAVGAGIVLASVVPPVIGALARRRVGVDGIALLAMGGALLLDGSQPSARSRRWMERSCKRRWTSA